MYHHRMLRTLVTAAVLVGLLLVPASAAFSDSAQITHPEAVAQLVKLGVLAGKPDGAFDPTAPVTRAELCSMMLKIQRVGQPGGSGQVYPPPPLPYSDIAGHWAQAAIVFCASSEVVSGRADGTFAPDASLTRTETLKILLAALGYSPKHEVYTGPNWDERVNVRAACLGLSAGTTLKPNDTVTRDDMAQLLMNTLNQKTVKYEFGVCGTGDDIYAMPKLITEETTLLQKAFPKAV